MTFTQFAIATIVVLGAIAIVESFAPQTTNAFVLLMLLSIAIAWPTFGPQVTETFKSLLKG